MHLLGLSVTHRFPAMREPEDNTEHSQGHDIEHAADEAGEWVDAKYRNRPSLSLRVYGLSCGFACSTAVSMRGI